jgi:hypothetical protein
MYLLNDPIRCTKKSFSETSGSSSDPEPVEGERAREFRKMAISPLYGVIKKKMNE